MKWELDEERDRWRAASAYMTAMLTQHICMSEPSVRKKDGQSAAIVQIHTDLKDTISGVFMCPEILHFKQRNAKEAEKRVRWLPPRLGVPLLARSAATHFKESF